MKKRFIQKPLIMILVVVLFVVSIISPLEPASAAVNKFADMSLRDQTIAVQYARLLATCLTSSTLSPEINVQEAGPGTYREVIWTNADTIVPVSDLIDPYYGKASCKEISIGREDASKPLTGGNAWRYLGLDTLDPKILLTEVLGYVPSAGSDSGGSTTYTLKASGLSYRDANNVVRNDGTITREFKIPYNQDDYDFIFGRYAETNDYCDFCWWEARSDAGYSGHDGRFSLYTIESYSGTVNIEELKTTFSQFIYNFYNRGALHNMNSFNSSREFYYIQTHGESSDGYVPYVFTTDSGYALVSTDEHGYVFDPDDNPPTITVTEGTTDFSPNTYVYSGGGAVQAFNKYVSKNFFGKQQSTTISFEDYPKQGYYFYYYHLVSDKICNARFAAKEDPETRARYIDGTKNSYFANVAVVKGGALEQMYADWSDQSEEYDGYTYEYTSIAAQASDIQTGSIYGVTNGLGANSSVGCTEVARRTTRYANMLSEEDLADPEIQADNMVIAAPGTTNPGTETSSANEINCYSSGGSLGWILCPLLEGISGAAKTFYEKAIQPFLSLNATLFSSSNDSPVYKAWVIFQRLANIVLIALMLFVIFSQVTGIGIDNYGIKKILPKLVIVAILINLSYFICQLAVDISNILGYGLRSMFGGIAAEISITSVVKEAVAVDTGATFWTVILVVVAGAAGFAAIYSYGLALLLPLFFAVLGVIISVLLLFVLLSVRQAGVILLVVISPLAFACYLLPNTKTLFDKWLKILQGLILFFPICGLLIGASELASKILLSTNQNDFFTALIAMLVGVVPFFFLPKLLKESFSAMGNIGAKITGAGKKFAGAATVRAKNSELYKRGGNRLRALPTTFSKRSRSSAIEAGDRVTREQRAARTLLQQKKYERMEQRNPGALSQENLQRQLTESLQNGNTEESLAQSDFIMSRLGPSKAATVFRSALEAAEANDPNFVGNKKRREILNALNDKYGQSLSSKDFALGRTLSTGGYNSITGVAESTASLNQAATYAMGDAGHGTDAQGRTLTPDSAGNLHIEMLSGLEEHAMKDEEAATLNKTSLESMFNAGQIDAQMARRVMANDKLTQGMDSETQSMWNHIASGTVAPSATSNTRTLDRNYVAPPPPPPAPVRNSHGAYENINDGSRVHLHEMSDGTFRNDDGFDVDITHYNKK